MSAAGGGATGVATTIEKLATLQNLVKRDPDAYLDEFKLQHKHFLAELDIFKMNPASPADTFIALVHFLSHVAGCYRKLLAEFPLQLVTLLTEHADVLQAGVRHALVQALILMRNRGLIQPVPLLKLFFSLFRVRDKFLRQLLFQHIVHDIRTLNHEKRDDSSNRAIQNFIYGLLSTADEVAASPLAARKSLDVLCELYRRHVWMDARTVNVIASALTIGNAAAAAASSSAAGGAGTGGGVSKTGASTGKNSKLMVAALKFFLGVGSAGSSGGDDDEDAGDSDLDSDADSVEGREGINLDPKAVRQAMAKHSHSKHTKKRQRQTARMLEGMKKSAAKEAGKAVSAFPAVQLLNDPQGLAERCFAILRSGGERFEVKMLLMNFISRLIGQHKLLLLPFYSFVQRYLTAHQAQVTQVLAFLVQACHDLVPPDEVLPVIRTIANAFIADRCGPELIQVGLNAVREVIAHCPVVLEEEGMKDLVSDLILYRKYKNRGVVASARSVLNLIRDIYPAVLRRKDWGKDVATDGSKAAARPTAYGLQTVATGIEGADLLAIALARKAQKRTAAAAAAAAGGDEEDDGDDEDGREGDASDDEGMMRLDDSGSDDGSEADGDEDAPMRRSARDSASLASSARAGGLMVAPADIAALADDDEWKPVELAKRREARKAGKAIPKPEALKSGTLAKAAAAAGGKAFAAGAASGGHHAADDSSDDDDLAELLGAKQGHGHGHGHGHGGDDDDGHGHEGHHHHADGTCCDDDDCDGDHGSDSDDGDRDDDDEDDDDDEEEEEDEDEEVAAAPSRAVAGSKRKRAEMSATVKPGRGGRLAKIQEEDDNDDEDEDDNEEDEEDGSEDGDEDEEASHAHSKSTGRTSAHTGRTGTSRMSRKAAEVAALAASVAPLLGAGAASSGASIASSGGPSTSAGAAAAAAFQLEAQRFLTPKDFARIRKMRAKLAEMGIDDRKANGKALLQRMLQQVARGGPMPRIPGITSDDSDSEEEGERESGDEEDEDEEEEDGGRPAAKRRRIDASGDDDTADKPKRKRRGGRNSGFYEDGTRVTDDEGSDGSDDEGRNQMAMPGVSFSAPVAAVDPRMLESDITKKKRRAAERLSDVLDEKTAKYEGKKPGGGMTNREKQRFKNYLMLRKSSAVQQKMKRSLSAAKKNVKAQLTSKANLERRKKQRRRRT